MKSGANLDILVERVNNAKQDQWVHLEDLGHELKRVLFSPYEMGKNFIWVAQSSLENSGGSGWIHPLNNNRLKTFKSILAAKKAFLESYGTKKAFYRKTK